MRAYVEYLFNEDFQASLNHYVKACFGKEFDGRVIAIYAKKSKYDALAACGRAKDNFPEFDFVITLYDGFFISPENAWDTKEMTPDEAQLFIIAHEFAHIRDFEGRKTRSHTKEHEYLKNKFFPIIMDEWNQGNFLETSSLRDYGNRIDSHYYYSIFDKNRKTKGTLRESIIKESIPVEFVEISKVKTNENTL